MKSFALLTAALALGLTLATGDADAAKRFGGGKSSGMQRQELSQPKSVTATPATPAQAPTAAAAPNRAQQAVKEYNQSPATEEGLFIMAQAYDKLGLAQLRDDSMRVLRQCVSNITPP